MNKTAKEWIASVKDPVIKRYLEENVEESKLDERFSIFKMFLALGFIWSETIQGDNFWYFVSESDPSTLSYSDFKHLDKSVETQLKEDKETSRELEMRQHAIDVFELTKGFTTKTTNKAMQTALEMAGYVLELTSKSTVEQPKVSFNEDAVELSYTPEFLEWRDRFFTKEPMLYEYITKQNIRYTKDELHIRYKKAMHVSPFIQPPPKSTKTT